ncbi:MAG TPA: hypothetical protein VFQ63_01290, partial [Patescibacteria group bacterium]|nr:hypothetical protein [Patescibacteria group bacterium]
ESLLGVSDEGTEPHALDAQEDTLAESPDNESANEAVDDNVSETDAQESSDESEDTDTREADENSDEAEETDETNDESEEEEQDDDQQERKRKLDDEEEDEEEKKKKRPPQEEAGPVVDTSANERRLGLLAEEIIRDATENGGEVSTQRVGQRFVTRVQGDRAAQSGIIFEMSTGATDKTPEWVAANMQTTGTTSVENAFAKAQAAVANNTAVAIGPHANVGDREVAKVGVPPELVGAQLRQRHASLAPAQIA